MRSRMFAALRGGVYAALLVLLWSWIVSLVLPVDDRLGWSFPRWIRGPAWAMIVAGACLVVSCVAAFAVHGRGTPAPFDAPRQFVAVGPYRWVRNPMYLGAAAVLGGVALLLESPATLGVTLMFLVLTALFVLFYEEPTLEKRFGDSYRAYKRRVRRWLPKPPAD